MQIQITVAPVKFEGGFVTITTPYTPLHSSTADVRTTKELESVLGGIIKNIYTDAQIMLRPLTRKVRGFDQWKTDKRAMLFIHGAEA